MEESPRLVADHMLGLFVSQVCNPTQKLSGVYLCIAAVIKSCHWACVNGQPAAGAPGHSVGVPPRHREVGRRWSG